jgi:hypothetical protein
MPKHSNLSPGSFADEADSWLDAIIAEEDEPDRVRLWRLGSWGFGAVVALTAGLMSTQIPESTKRTELTAVELAEQSRQLQSLTRDTRQETRRLTAAVETLGKDRDRLFGRVSVVEQGLDSVTGSIQRSAALGESAAAAGPDKVTEPTQKLPPATIATAPVDSIPASPPQVQSSQAQSGQMQSSQVQAKTSPPAQPVQTATVQAATTPPAKSNRADQPVSAAAVQPAAAPAPSPLAAPAVPVVAALAPSAIGDASEAADGTPVPRTQFGLDLGGASSMEGLRALWKGISRSHRDQLATLTPVLSIKQGGKGIGLQVHVVAGPITDAATAARLCAVLAADDRPCETTVFEGQRLIAGLDDSAKKPANPARPVPKRKQASRQSSATPPAAPAAEKSTLSSMLGIR